LSFNLYSGQQKRILIKIESEALSQMPAEWKPYTYEPKSSDGHRVLSASIWANKELNTPLVSEWRILRELAKHVTSKLPKETPPSFYIDYRHLPQKGSRLYSVEEIDQMREGSQ
ncbi:MAG: hypothetical protein F6K21_39965, partial [Symploca sp. SIO2D2]|nr:hypothetical protein [Symploca sp. SIO2D2]